MYHELICTDCAIYIANNDLPPDTDDDRDDEIRAGSEKIYRELKYPSVGDDYGFSQRSCWSCGDTHHGNRHYLNYIDSID